MPQKEVDLTTQAEAILNIVGIGGIQRLTKDFVELYDLMNLSEEEEQEMADEAYNGNLDYFRHLRGIRIIYILSKMSHDHHRTFKKLHKHSDFWKKVEKEAKKVEANGKV